MHSILRTIVAMLTLGASAQATSSPIADGWKALQARRCDQAMAILEPMAREQSAGAEKLVGDMYFFGWCKTKDRHRSFIYYEKAARRGLGAAEHSLGLSYENGHGVERNASQAAYWYQKAADQGVAVAMCNLAALYFTGQGVTPDAARGVQLTAAAGRLGYACQGPSWND
jgi:TPR repeat protein